MFPVFGFRTAPNGTWSVGTGGGGGGAYCLGGMVFISRDSCGGKVPDIGVRMGDEMLMPLIPFFLGDRSADKIEEAREWVFSFSDEPPKFRWAGLFFSFFEETDDLSDMDGRWLLAMLLPLLPTSGAGGPSRTMPLALASSCSMTYL